MEFHQVTKKPPGRRNPRQKLDPNEVRAGCISKKDLASAKENNENSDNKLLGDRLLRPLSFVEEEDHETVSRGTSPMPSPLLRRDFNNSNSAHFTFDEVFSVHPSESPDEETNVNVELPIQDTENERAPEVENAASDSHSDKKEDIEIEHQEGVDECEDEGEEYTENMPELVSNNRFFVMGSYEKEEEQEVNLRENAEVEVLEESEGGWWLVRTSSHSVGWAPSNFLEKVQSLRRGSVEDGKAKDATDENFIEVIPIRPPKSPRVLKMAQDMCIEKNFWCFIQKGKDTDSCPLDDKNVKRPENANHDTDNNQPTSDGKENNKEVMTLTFDIQKSKEMDTCPLDEKDVKTQETSDDTNNNQTTSDEKENNNEVMTLTFDDYECDPVSGVCMRKSHKSAGVKYMPQNNVPDSGLLQAQWDPPGVIERSESVPSLAESEDFDDLPSE